MFLNTCLFQLFMAKGSIVLKKKQWLNIVAPKEFGGMEMGETYISEPEEAIGKTLFVSLANLMGDYQKQSINIKFRIINHENGLLNTVFEGYFMTPSSVRKLVRKAKDKMDDSFPVKTADNVSLRIKIVMVTKSRTKGSILAALKKNAREIMAKLVGSLSLEMFAKEVSIHKIQQSLSKELRKTYPLSICEIRLAEISKDQKKTEENVEPVSEVVNQSAEKAAV